MSTAPDRPLVKVLGDVAWLHLYRVSKAARDYGGDSLLPYRRVKDSQSLRTPGGAWAVARFVRNAVGDITRLPINAAVSLDDYSVVFEAAFRPVPGISSKSQIDKTSGKPAAFKLAIANDAVSLSVPATRVSLELVGTKSEPQLQITADVLPTFKLRSLNGLLQSGTLSTVEFTTDDLALQQNDEMNVRATLKRRRSAKPQSRSMQVAVFSSNIEYAACSAYLDTEDEDVSKLLVDRPRSSTGASVPPLLQLPAKGKLVFPGTCGFGFGKPATHSISDGWSQKNKVNNWKLGGICILRLPDGQERQLPFTTLLQTRLLRTSLILDRDILEAVLPIDCTQRQQRLIQVWQQRLLRNLPFLAHVQTYSQSSAESAMKIWWEMKNEPAGDAVRLNRVMGYDARLPIESSHRHGELIEDYLPPQLVNSSPRHLVFFDLNFGFRRPVKSNTFTEDWIDALGDWHDSPESERGWILGCLGRSLPISSQKKSSSWDKHDLWSVLRKGAVTEDKPPQPVEFKQKVIVVVSAELMRANGARISYNLSWEHTATDCINALNHSRRLKPILSFQHVVIRIGSVGAIYIDQHHGRKFLIFDALAEKEFFREPDEGRVLGSNSVLTSCILRSILQHESSLGRILPPADIGNAIRLGIKQAIPAMDHLFSLGYDKFTCIPETDFLDYKAPEHVFCALDGMSAEDPSKDTKSHIVTAISEVEFTDDESWSVIDGSSEQVLLKAATEYVQTRGLGDDDRRTARKRASPGLLKLRDNAYVPIAQFGLFTAVAKEEIESFRSIQAILKRYINGNEKKPISVGVFGPPGSGKSFGIREVAESIGRAKVSWHEFNLAQFSSPNDLVIPLLKARDVEGQKVPVIFFDEFDSKLGETPLGWLRYFLQPMQDGTFKHGEEVRTVGRAIFVFAGGTSESFSQFAREGGPRQTTEEEKAEFRLAKGPDFVSRLSGYIDTLGINRRRPSDSGYVLRRAVLLRSILEKRALIGDTGRSLVDDRLISSLLKITSFKHGARSMDILLKMCIGNEGELRLPSLGQLEMHVGPEDAKSLWKMR